MAGAPGVPEAHNDRVHLVLRVVGRQLRPPRTLGDDAVHSDLGALGLPSLGMVSTIVELEAAWGVTLPAERFVPETFRSVDSIAAAFAPSRGTTDGDARRA